MEMVPTALRYTWPLQDFWSTLNPCPDIGTLFLPMLTRIHLSSMLVFQRISFSCRSSNIPKMMTRSSAYMFSQGILYVTLRRGLSRTKINSGGSDNSPVGHPLSHQTLHLGCNQHVLCFWNFIPCYTWASPATSPPDRPSGYTVKCFSRSTKAMWFFCWWRQTYL